MPENQNNDELAIAYSSALLELISHKVRNHNKNSDRKVTATQLKEVFANAAKSYDYAGYTRSHWSLARVNTFLRVAGGETPKLIKEREQTSLGGLVFESKIIVKEKEYDISENWIPSQEDFSLAGEEIKKYNLTYNFNNLDELYLNKTKPVGLVFNFEL
tara:strand:- start:874 stop:1350 length:477 start_codon:yes stop_codon:yes gene_type:complete